MYRIYFCAILSINYVKHSLEVEKVFVSPYFSDFCAHIPNIPHFH